MRARTARPLQFLRERIGSWGLIIGLMALPIYYTLHDLIAGYQAGVVNGHAVIHHDLSQIGFNLSRACRRFDLGADRDRLHAGLRHHRADQLRARRRVHDGLVPGVAVGARWADPATGPVGVVSGTEPDPDHHGVRDRRLNVLIERVGYKPLRNAPKLAPLITAVGFSFVLQNVGLLWHGGNPVSVPDLVRSGDTLFNISGVAVHRRDVLAIGR